MNLETAKAILGVIAVIYTTGLVLYLVAYGMRKFFPRRFN